MTKKKETATMKMVPTIIAIFFSFFIIYEFIDTKIGDSKKMNEYNWNEPYGTPNYPIVF